MVRLISSRSSGKQLTLQEEFVGTLLPRKGMTSQLQPGQNRLAEIPYSPKSPPDRCFGDFRVEGCAQGFDRLEGLHVLLWFVLR